MWVRLLDAARKPHRLREDVPPGFAQPTPAPSSRLHGYANPELAFLPLHEADRVLAEELEWLADELEVDSTRLRELAKKLKTTSDVRAFLAPDTDGLILDALLALTPLERRGTVKAMWESPPEPHRDRRTRKCESLVMLQIEALRMSGPKLYAQLMQRLGELDRHRALMESNGDAHEPRTKRSKAAQGG